MEYNKDEGKLYVVFTLVDYPASHFTIDELDVIGYDSLPADVKRNLSQVIDNIGHAVHIRFSTSLRPSLGAVKYQL